MFCKGAWYLLLYKEETWYSTGKLILFPFFIFSCYEAQNWRNTWIFKHFSVRFFIEGFRAHWKDSVKPAAAPVLPLHIQVGMWPDTAGCILSASLLPIELFWYSLTTAAPREKKTPRSAVILNSLPLVKKHPIKKRKKNLDPVRRQVSVHSKHSYLLLVIFSRTISSVNTYSDLHVDFD